MANRFYVEPANVFQALLAGDRGYNQAVKANQEDAVSAAGKLYASGDIKGAQAQAAQGGQSGLALLMNMVQQQNNERDYALRQAQFDEQKRQFNVGAEGQKVPQGFQPDPTKPGTFRPIPGGPQDPEYIDRTRKGPSLSVSDITKLSDEGGKFANLTGFIGGFKDQYGGKGLGVIGEAQNWAGRNLPPVTENLRNNADQSSWWQSYDRYKNVVRNDLFGASLTASEQAAFDKADINPGMQPDQIRKNLQIQRDIVESGIKRKAGALISAGHDPQTISKAYGMTPEQLGVPAKKGGTPAAGPVRASSKQEYDALPSGTQYIAPDGSLRTKQ